MIYGMYFYIYVYSTVLRKKTYIADGVCDDGGQEQIDKGELTSDSSILRIISTRINDRISIRV